MTEPFDEPAVVERAKSGDSEAFGLLFTRYQQPLYRYVYRLIGSTMYFRAERAKDAHDLSQDTFVKAWRYLPRSGPETSTRFRPWLHRIAHNVCMDELRHRQAVKWEPWDQFTASYHPERFTDEDLERDVLLSEECMRVRALLNQLPPRIRTALILQVYQEQTYDEIAAVMDTTHTAVKSLLHRGRISIREQWQAAERRAQRTINTPRKAP